jgi:dipeptidase E
LGRRNRFSEGHALKLLLTSAGIKNRSIEAALVELLGKPIAESSALCIPTASYGMGLNGPAAAWRFTSGLEPECPMIELGWRSMGVLELTALSSLGRDRWVPAVEATDVLLVNGGDPMFLHHWMVESGFAELIPSLPDVVYVGLSAGSMVLTPRIGEDFVEWRPPAGDDRTLGIVDFAIFPHLEHPDLPDNTMAHAERWAATMRLPCYAIDDQTAIRVVNGSADVVSEGHWRRFEHDR